MRIIVSDTCCMIDLRKAALLEEMLRLPYTFIMPAPLFDDEWLSLSDAEKTRLRDLGLEIHDLPGPMVERAAAYFNQHRRLNLNDCFALVLAEETEEGMLLTGDALLRRVAEENDVEARGVLWVTDELETHAVVPVDRLHQALRLLQDDDLVFLPEAPRTSRHPLLISQPPNRARRINSLPSTYRRRPSWTVLSLPSLMS